MKRQLSAWFLIFMTPFLCAGADEKGQRHTEAAGKFSIVPPANWQVRDFQGLKYKVIIGPVQGAFASNINVVDEPYQGSLDDYAKANVEAMKARFVKFKILKQEAFKTTSGLTGVRLITENEQSGMMVRQTFYLFGKPMTKYVVTCSTLVEGGEKLDPIFEKSLATFQFEP